MLKQILKGGSIYAFSDLLRKLAPFILLPLFVTNLSIDEFGRLEYITVISTLFAYLVGWGSIQGLLRLYVDDGPKYTFVTLQIVSVSFLLLIFIIFILQLILNYLDYFNFENIKIFYLCIVYGWLFSVTNIALTVLRIEERLKEFAVYNLLSTFLQIVVVSLFLLIFKLGYLSKIYGLVISYTIILFILFNNILKNKIIVVFSFKLIKSTLSFFTPITFVNLLGWWGSSIDKLVIKAFLGDEALGLYSFVYQITQVFKLGFESFLKSFNVLIYKNIEMNEVLRKYQLLILGIIQILSLAYFAVILLLSSKGVFGEYYILGSVLCMLMLSRILLLAKYLEVLKYYVEKNSKTVLKANLAAAAVLTVSISIFVELWGEFGAALSVVLSILSNYMILSWQRDKNLYILLRKLLITVIPFSVLLIGVI